MARLDAFFKLMFDSGASDLHITSGQPPILRVHGELERVKYDPMDDETLRAMLYEIAPEQKVKQFEETGDVDFGYEIPGVARFRANYFMQKYGCGAVFRQIPTKVVTADELGLPAILKKCALLHKGLVLVTGPTGSGKSTTLAAVLDHANKHRKDHIITIEDPIEFLHTHKRCIVNQREVGQDALGLVRVFGDVEPGRGDRVRERFRIPVGSSELVGDAVEALAEAIRIGRDGHLPAQISHIKLGSVAVWGRAAEAVALIDKARQRGQDLVRDRVARHEPADDARADWSESIAVTADICLAQDVIPKRCFARPTRLNGPDFVLIQWLFI